MRQLADKRGGGGGAKSYDDKKALHSMYNTLNTLWVWITKKSSEFFKGCEIFSAVCDGKALNVSRWI